MTNSHNWIIPYEKRINSALESLLPDDDSILTKAIRYSVLNGGKRLRPLLVYLSAELGSSSPEAQDAVSCAVELIHCYSLCLLYTSPSPRDQRGSRMPSSA